MLYQMVNRNYPQPSSPISDTKAAAFLSWLDEQLDFFVNSELKKILTYLFHSDLWTEYVKFGHPPPEAQKCERHCDVIFANHLFHVANVIV